MVAAVPWTDVSALLKRTDRGALRELRAAREEHARRARYAECQVEASRAGAMADLLDERIATVEAMAMEEHPFCMCWTARAAD